MRTRGRAGSDGHDGADGTNGTNGTNGSNGAAAIQTVATLTHLMLALGAVILAVGIAYATLCSRMSAVEARMPVREADHDMLISICTDVANIKSDIKEIKGQLMERRPDVLASQ